MPLDIDNGTVSSTKLFPLLPLHLIPETPTTSLASQPTSFPCEVGWPARLTNFVVSECLKAESTDGDTVAINIHWQR